MGCYVTLDLGFEPWAEKHPQNPKTSQNDYNDLVTVKKLEAMGIEPMTAYRHWMQSKRATTAPHPQNLCMTDALRLRHACG